MMNMMISTIIGMIISTIISMIQIVFSITIRSKVIPQAQVNHENINW